MIEYLFILGFLKLLHANLNISLNFIQKHVISSLTVSKSPFNYMCVLTFLNSVVLTLLSSINVYFLLKFYYIFL